MKFKLLPILLIFSCASNNEICSTHNIEGEGIVIHCPSGAKIVVHNDNITVGPPGSQGVQGIQGVQGVQGEVGIQGPVAISVINIVDAYIMKFLSGNRITSVYKCEFNTTHTELTCSK